MPNELRPVECNRHGQAYGVVVCRHLPETPGQKWVCSFPSKENPWPDAWCKACYEGLRAKGKWKEDPYVDRENLQIVCHYCYEELKGQCVAPLLEEKAIAWQPLRADSMAELQQKQEDTIAEFALQDHDRWEVDTENRRLVLSADGNTIFSARLDLAGTFDAQSGTWLWSWANWSWEPRVAEALLKVRAFGARHQLANLMIAKWPVLDNDQASVEVVAVATKILGGHGFYCGSTDYGAAWFLLLEDLRKGD